MMMMMMMTEMGRRISLQCSQFVTSKVTTTTKTLDAPVQFNRSIEIVPNLKGSLNNGTKLKCVTTRTLVSMITVLQECGIPEALVWQASGVESGRSELNDVMGQVSSQSPA